MKSLIVLTLLLVVFKINGTPDCPEPELIRPCTCKVFAYGLNVVCADVKSNQELRRKFQRLSDYHIVNLLLHALNVSDTVPEGLFTGMSVNVLQLEMSQVTFSGEAFRGLENSLKQLKVMCCRIPDKEIKLARLNKLNDFHFRKNNLAKVSGNWLKDSIPNVRILNLDNNDIVTVEDGAFSTLNQIRVISLADNQISAVSRSMFPSSATKLSQIDLSHNQLSTLPADIFKQMPNLQKVVLSGNNLRSIPEDTWSEIWSQMNAVILYENQIVCDEGIEWIKEKKKPKMLEGTCEEPAAVMGKPLKEVLEK